jgi:hypothetical protein
VRPLPSPNWRLEPLAGWHLPLLGDPAFLPLQQVLQRAALLGLPQQLLQRLGLGRTLAAQVVVAFAEHSQTVLGLVVSRPLNRSGSCWQVQHLRTTRRDLRSELSADLLKAAIARANASSWVAAAASDDRVRLAVLREQGFQPLRQDQLWCLAPPNAIVSAGAGSIGELQLKPLNRRTAAQLWHLEQAACPAQLRQILDRRIDDLLAQSQGLGWMLIDPARDVAVAAVRWQGDHPGGGQDLELTVHPGWEHLHGQALQCLLHQASQQWPSSPLWVRSDPYDSTRQTWLQAIGAQQRGERVLMARSLWRRQASAEHQLQANRRLEAVLAQLQPGRRPVPTPLLRR